MSTKRQQASLLWTRRASPTISMVSQVCPRKSVWHGGDHTRSLAWEYLAPVLGIRGEEI